MNIAIQGILGSFHHIVANQYFGDTIKLTECLSFDEMPRLINSNQVDGAVMAIENTLAGSILSNYALINEFDLKIQGEVHLPIQHNLMALEGQLLSDIKEVWSHPMAILQCRKFFRDYPEIRLVEAADTAEVAKQIREKQLMGIAAIASKKAAEIFGLNIIESKIQTRKQNYTRFFVLKKNNGNIVIPKVINKASLRFVTHHQTGSLSDVLRIFANFNMNLSKIQSLPIIDDPWNYAFFVDVIFDNYQQFQNAIEKVKENVSELKILGEYQQSKRKYAS
ncbi:prephenate dehydratase [Aureibaculum marinum]|uniref:prephenate dehydratase n=1 Tax=Aureibaculum marinum TaxID=2487930 RepID=A0A3N4NTU6_9FLAO|nr:prephenate dehydratase [Aureibaculum marinum]RPD96456.1 prephenate dehydratase [Aureibaculum marinum]